MFKSSNQNPENPVLVMGITDQNIELLKNDQPIATSLADFGVNLPGFLLLLHGATEEAIAAKLNAVGITGTVTKAEVDPVHQLRAQRLKENEKILIVMTGLPRSGKSTWSRSTGYPMVNPDSIRLAIHGQKFLPESDDIVWAHAKAMVRSLFIAGHQVVVFDACNVTRKSRQSYLSNKWTTFYKPIYTPADDCFSRAADDNDEEMIRTIERMNNNFEPLGVDEPEWV